MKSIKRDALQTLKVVILALTLTVGVNYIFAVDWTPPTATPPGGNTSAPLNVTNAGQIKWGGLTVAANPTVTNGLIVANGKTGLATQAPTRTLDVAGETRLRGHLYGVDNNAGSVGQVLTRTSTGPAWQTASGGGGGGGITGGMENQIAKFSSATAITNSQMTESASGQVGVGTAAPTARLDVNGNVRIRGTSGFSDPAVGKVLTSDANGLASWQYGVYAAKRSFSCSGQNTCQHTFNFPSGYFSAAPVVTCSTDIPGTPGNRPVVLCSVQSVSASSVVVSVDAVLSGGGMGSETRNVYIMAKAAN